MTQRQDNNLPAVTENVFPDKLYRLDHTVGDSSTVMSYDSMGRISQWGAGGVLSNVKDYTTPQSGCTYYANSQPHAVRSNTNAGSSYSPASYCYDANGNMISVTNPHGAASYSWTSYNQPDYISGFGNSSQLFYDGNHQRYKQIASYSGALETTYYIGGLLEKMANSSGIAYRHYIPAGNNTVVYTRLSGSTTPTTYYITKDHLGSSAVITTDSNSTTPLVKEKFSALGWNENTVAEEATMATVTRHEFTGHEGLDSVSLVNMNGRVYDPSGSMFLSPDPRISDPGNTQSYNRYSYVNNNPLSFVDPTGFDLAEIVVTSSTPSDGSYTNDGDGGYSGNAGSEAAHDSNAESQAVTAAHQVKEIKVMGHRGFNLQDLLKLDLTATLDDLLHQLDALNILSDVLCQKSVREAVAGGAAGMAAAAVLTKSPYGTLAGGAFGAYLGAVGSKDSATLSAVVGLALGIFDPVEGVTLSLGSAINGAASNLLGTAIGGRTLGAAATAGAAGAGSFWLSGAGSLASGAGARAVLLPSLAAGVAYKAVSAPLNASCGGG